MGYAEPNNSMLHDYFHFTLCDLLDKNKVPYLTENDLRCAGKLNSLLNGLTPDLIIDTPGNMLPTVIDVYAGNSDKSMKEKKDKYARLGSVMTFKTVTLASPTAALKDILSQDDQKYLRNQLVIFSAEFAYWSDCLRLKRILFNELDDIAYSPPSTSHLTDPLLGAEKAKFLQRMEALANVLDLFKQKVHVN